MSDLRISVSLCTYNGDRFLLEQLESLAKQSRLPDQLVIADDASSDRSLQIAESFAARAPFPVEVHAHTRNVGYAANFGRALERCDGAVLALCDQDDVWHPEKLARLEAVFEADPGVGMVFSDAELVDSELRPLGSTMWQAAGFSPAQRRIAEEEGVLEVLLFRSVVMGAAMAFRARHVGLVLPVGDRVDHDAWIALLISTTAEVAFVEEPLLLYRQHGGNQIGAPQRGLVSRWRLARTERRRVLARHRELCSSVLERLVACGVENEKVERLRRSIHHLALRTSLPQPRLRRIHPVAGLLADGGYGKGRRAAVRAIADLLG
jgi:glycosyltransferase involved in cell wall biosynthesis